MNSIIATKTNKLLTKFLLFAPLPLSAKSHHVLRPGSARHSGSVHHCVRSIVLLKPVQTLPGRSPTSLHHERQPEQSGRASVARSWLRSLSDPRTRRNSPKVQRRETRAKILGDFRRISQIFFPFVLLFPKMEAMGHSRQRLPGEDHRQQGNLLVFGRVPGGWKDSTKTRRVCWWPVDQLPEGAKCSVDERVGGTAQ